MSEPEVVFQEISPHGNLEAVVEQDDRVAHFYLRSPDFEDFGIKICWIRNLAAAPERLDVEGMRQGIAPMLPKEFCLHAEGQEPLDPERGCIDWLVRFCGRVFRTSDQTALSRKLSVPCARSSGRIVSAQMLDPNDSTRYSLPPSS